MKLRKKRRTAEAVTSLLPYFSWLCERKAYKSKAIVASKRRRMSDPFNFKKQNGKVSVSDDHQRATSDTTTNINIVKSVTPNVTSVTTVAFTKRDNNDLSHSFILETRYYFFFLSFIFILCRFINPDFEHRMPYHLDIYQTFLGLAKAFIEPFFKLHNHQCMQLLFCYLYLVLQR